MELLNFFILSFVINLTSSYVVEIENGKIEGTEHESFYAFKGIPYAVAERFSLPKPFSEKWNDVRKFMDYGPICAQYDYFTYGFLGEENCLSLNVFVPTKVIESPELVPVIFFIHGGAFMFGSTLSYGPDNIMKNGSMIVVSINYRLGILGFLSTEDEVLPGNLGLKDQVEALKWVQKNIKAFNGDPQKVTLVGFSAGAASVHLHYMSKLSNTLFNNGISHSGAATNTWVFMENAREKAHLVANYSECPFDNHQIMLNCLKEKPVKELTLIAKKFQPYLYSPFSPFGVVIEVPTDNAFITEDPKQILLNGNFKKASWLFSQVKDEGNYPAVEFFRDDNSLKFINENWEDLVPFILDYYGLSNNNELKKDLATMIRKFYLKDEKISIENYQAFNDIFTDRLHKSETVDVLKMQSNFSPSFMYFFNYKSLSGLGDFISNGADNFSIAHGEDVFLMFKSIFRVKPYSDDEKAMIENLIGVLYSFATTNVPTFNGFNIERSTPDKIQCLEIISNDDFKMIGLDENYGKSTFWKDIESILKNGFTC